MRVFLAGASGVVGPPLISRLKVDGHEVAAMTRSERKAESLAELGAEPVVADALDRDGLAEAVTAARPDAVVNHLTDLSGAFGSARPGKEFERNDRIRAEGGPNVVAAARESGASRVVAQSVAFLYAPEGRAVNVEEDPLYRDAPAPVARAVDAVLTLEQAVTQTDGIDGVALRFGFWYGPRTGFARGGPIAGMFARRRYPIVGDGSATTSFVHLDDVVEATVAALDAPPGIYNVVDDDPAPASEWIPFYADALGAPPPRRVPAFLTRLVAGPYAHFMTTKVRGASNEKAKRELGWVPKHPTWRSGLVEAPG